LEAAGVKGAIGGKKEFFSQSKEKKGRLDYTCCGKKKAGKDSA